MGGLQFQFPVLKSLPCFPALYCFLPKLVTAPADEDNGNFPVSWFSLVQLDDLRQLLLISEPWCLIYKAGWGAPSSGHLRTKLESVRKRVQAGCADMQRSLSFLLAAGVSEQSNSAFLQCCLVPTKKALPTLCCGVSRSYIRS